MKRHLLLMCVACLTSAVAMCQTAPMGEARVYQSLPVIVQFGPGEGSKFTARMSRVELWKILRKGSTEGLTEIADLTALQASLPRHVVLAEGDLFHYKPKLKVFRFVPSEKPNQEFLSMWQQKASDEKDSEGAGGIDDLTPTTALDWLREKQPTSYYSSWLYTDVSDKLDGFGSTVDSLFTTSEWEKIAEGEIHNDFNDDWKTVGEISKQLPTWSNDPDNSETISKITVELERVAKELISVQDLVGAAIALSPSATFDEVTADRAKPACKAFETGLSNLLLPHLGEVRASMIEQTGYVVIFNPIGDYPKIEPVGFPTEYSGHKFYSVNTAGPFFFDLPTFSYSVKKETNNGTDSFKLVESGKQSSMKSSVGAFYNQMYQLTDQFHLGLSIGVVASENSRIGYGIGLTTRIGGVFLTYGQLYTPVSEARFVPGSVFDNQADADAAKTLSQDSFKWRPFIGLALRF